MPNYIAGLYLGIGLLVSGFTFAAFPPVPGYKPNWLVVCLAALTYIVLWPILGLMAFVYLVGIVFFRHANDLIAETTQAPHRLRHRILFEEAHLHN